MAIIGAGPSGLAAAKEAMDLGMEVLTDMLFIHSALTPLPAGRLRADGRDRRDVVLPREGGPELGLQKVPSTSRS